MDHETVTQKITSNSPVLEVASKRLISQNRYKSFNNKNMNKLFQQSESPKKGPKINILSKDYQDKLQQKNANLYDLTILDQEDQKVPEEIFSPEFIQLINDQSYIMGLQITEKSQQQQQQNTKKQQQEQNCSQFRKSVSNVQNISTFGRVSSLQKHKQNKKRCVCLCKKKSMSTLFKDYKPNKLEQTPYQNKRKTVNRFLIDPNNKIKLNWDILCMILILYEMVTIPFRLSFEKNALQYEFFKYLQSQDIYMDSVFLIDILLNFNTSIYEKGVLITDRKVIIKNYLKLWFWVDLISSFPYSTAFSFFVLGSQGQEYDKLQYQSDKQYLQQNKDLNTNLINLVKLFRFVKILRLLRVAKLKVILVNLIEYLQISQSLLNILGFIKLALIVLFIAHWCACLWHLVGQSDPDNNWLIKAQIFDEVWTVRYITSIYWAVTTMITVGYGDITPQNPREKVFAIFTMLLACAVFAYTMNTMGIVLQSLENQEYKKELLSITKYLKTKKVPNIMQVRIRKYLDYVEYNKQKNYINESALLNKLSHSLKNDLIVEINGRVLNNSPFLINNFDEALLYDVTLILQEKLAIPEEVIFTELQGNKEDNSLYFIHEGQVDIYFNKTQTLLHSLTKNQCFGEVAFFADQERSASARSSDFTNLFYLQRKDFLKQLEKHPNQYEKFMMIKDKINLYDDYSDLNIQCYSCEEFGHLISKCPYLQFLPSKNKRNKANIFVQKQIVCGRNQKQRFIQNKFHSIKQQHKIQQKIQTLIFKQSGLIQNYQNQFQMNNQDESYQINIPYGDNLKNTLIEVNNKNTNYSKNLQKNIQYKSSKQTEISYIEWLNNIQEYDKQKNFYFYFVNNNLSTIQQERELKQILQENLLKLNLDKTKNNSNTKSVFPNIQQSEQKEYDMYDYCIE